MVRTKKGEVRRLRERKGLSQTELADMAGWCVRTIQRIEAGEPVKQTAIKNICTVLEISLADVIDGEEIIPKEMSFSPETAPRFARVVCEQLQKADVDSGAIYDAAVGLCWELAGVLGQNIDFAQQLAAEVDEYLCPPGDGEFLSDLDID